MDPLFWGERYVLFVYRRLSPAGSSICWNPMSNFPARLSSNRKWNRSRQVFWLVPDPAGPSLFVWYEKVTLAERGRFLKNLQLRTQSRTFTGFPFQFDSLDCW